MGRWTYRAEGQNVPKTKRPEDETSVETKHLEEHNIRRQNIPLAYFQYMQKQYFPIISHSKNTQI
jgi:hypothetical protein